MAKSIGHVTATKRIASAAVFPTRGGVDRTWRLRLLMMICVFPTRVGVDRVAAQDRTFPIVFSPHAWGWTVLLTVFDSDADVFPTRVGVDRIG
jgi:hypothetical protein